MQRAHDSTKPTYKLSGFSSAMINVFDMGAFAPWSHDNAMLFLLYMGNCQRQLHAVPAPMLCPPAEAPGMPTGPLVVWQFFLMSLRRWYMFVTCCTSCFPRSMIPLSRRPCNSLCWVRCLCRVHAASRRDVCCVQPIAAPSWKPFHA